MGLRISTNVSSLAAQRAITRNSDEIQRSSERLANGDRINRAADDAAGLSISTHLNAQIRSLTQATHNANNAISLMQVAEGSLNEISNMIVRLRELSIQAGSDTLGDMERGFVNTEVQQLKREIDRVAQTTKWNTTKLLDGTTPDFSFQVGIFNNADDDRITFIGSENVATLAELGLSDVDVGYKTGAHEALTKLDRAQTRVNGIRANLGSIDSRLHAAATNLNIHYENFSASKSRIRDADMAVEVSNNVKDRMLLDSATSTLAQANQNPQVALKLFG